MTTPGGSFTPQFSYADLVPIDDTDPETVTGDIAALESAVNALAADVNAAEARIAVLESAAPASTAPPTILVNGASTIATASTKGLTVYYEVYANNAAALAAGLTAGTLYLTATGEVRGVLPAGGGGGVVVTPPPSGTELISTATVTTPHYEGATNYYWVWGKRWSHDSAYKSWSISSTDDNAVKFEVRAGDTFTSPGFTDSTGVERNRLVERESEWHGPTEDVKLVGRVKIEGPTITSNFFQVVELHTFHVGGTTLNSQNAKKFELVIQNERWRVTSNYSATSGNAVYRDLYVGTVPIVRGKEYDITIYNKSNHTSGGRVIVEIDGTRVVDFTGQVGFHTENKCATEFGIYRGNGTPETIQVTHTGWVCTYGAYGTVSEPAAPETPGTGQTYGPNLVVDGTFTGTANWTATGATLSVASNELTVTESTTGSGTHSASQAIPVVSGAQYRIQGEFYRNANATNCLVTAYRASDLGTATTTSTTLTTFDFTITADATYFTLHLQVEGGDIGDIGYYRNVTVRKVL